MLRTLSLSLVSFLAAGALAIACSAEESGAEPSGERGKIGKADLVGSCVSDDNEPACDGQSPDGGCWCDAGCTAFGDCCEGPDGAAKQCDRFRGECTVENKEVIGCGTNQVCIFTKCDPTPECEIQSGACCDGTCVDLPDNPGVNTHQTVECGVVDGEVLGCEDTEVCLEGPCMEGCEVGSLGCCEARCVSIVDEDPGPVDVPGTCSVTDDGVVLGCGSDEVCMFGPCTDCEGGITSADCCETACVRIFDPDPTFIQCDDADDCDDGEVCEKTCVDTDDCSGGPDCCESACRPEEP